MHNETLSIAAMCVCNPDRSPVDRVEAASAGARRNSITSVARQFLEAAEPLKKSSYNTNMAARA
jgi:hypothetical protein